jgi:GTPase SAR1 family protein
MAEIEKYAKDSVLKFLVGNKCDLIEKRAISTEEGQNLGNIIFDLLANIYGMPFLETSAKDTVNINELFQTTMRGYIDRLNKKGNNSGIFEKKATILLDVNKTENKKECCLYTK